MNARWLLLALFLIPTANAAFLPEPLQAKGLDVQEGNQRVDLTWSRVEDERVQGYEVRVYLNGVLHSTQNTTDPAASFLLTNGRTYVFVVGLQTNATWIPSDPTAATPHLERDLQYLAAGLIVTWIGLFGYAAVLARKEQELSQRLERLLQHQFGRNPP